MVRIKGLKLKCPVLKIILYIYIHRKACAIFHPFRKVQWQKKRKKNGTDEKLRVKPDISLSKILPMLTINFHSASVAGSMQLSLFLSNAYPYNPKSLGHTKLTVIQ